MARLGAALVAMLACLAVPRPSFAGFLVYGFEWTEHVTLANVSTSTSIPALLTGGVVTCCEVSGPYHLPSELTFQVGVPQTTPVSTITGTSFDVLARHTLAAAQVDFRVTPGGVTASQGVAGRQHFAFVGAGGVTAPILSIPLNIGAGTTHRFVTEPIPGLTISVTVWNYGWTQHPVTVMGLTNSPYLGGDGTRQFFVTHPVMVGEILSPNSIFVFGLVVAPTKIHVGGANPTTYATFSSFRFEATFPTSVPEPGEALLLAAGAAMIAFAVRRAKPS